MPSKTVIYVMVENYRSLISNLFAARERQFFRIAMVRSKRPRAKKLKKPSAPKTYSWTGMMAIAINYIIGTGMLALPPVTAGSSVFISLVLVLLAIVMSTIPAIVMGDVIARCYALRAAHLTLNERLGTRKAQRRAARARKISVGRSQTSDTTVSPDEHQDHDPLHMGLHQQGGSPGGDALAPQYVIPGDEDFVVSELTRIVYGDAGFYIYQIVIIFFLLTALWSYGNVVSSSLTSVIPFYGLPAYRSSGHKVWVCGGPCQPHYYEYCSQAYWIWICITYVFSQTMVFFDLSEQRVMQTIFTYCRFLVLILVIAIGAIALGVGPFYTPPLRLQPPYQASGFAYLYYNTSAVGNLYSLIIFSLMFHYAIPSLIKPLKQSDHHRLAAVWVITNLVVLAVSLCIMYIDGAFFGADSASLVTLNFVMWDGVFWNNVTGHKPWWSYLISYVVRLLPPIYVLTGIPINAIVIAENIRAIFSHRLQKRKWVVVLTRVLAILPAMLLAGFLRCLSVILNYAGIVGYVVLVIPVMLAHSGRQQCKRLFGRQHEFTPHTNFGSSPVVAWLFYCMIAIEFSVTLYALIIPVP